MSRIALLPVLLLAVLASSPAFSRNLGCIGSHHVREYGIGGSNPGSEWETTHYRFRNYNSDRVITVSVIEIFADDGTLLGTFGGGVWPAGFNPLIGPNQSTGFDLDDVFGNVAAPGGILQTVITWSPNRILGTTPLFVHAARLTRTRGGGGGQRETTARAIVPCTPLL